MQMVLLGVDIALCRMYSVVMTTFSDIIALWPTVADFAKETGIPYPSAAAMKQRNSIGSRYWSKVVEAAKARGLDVTPDRLMEIAAQQRGAS